MLRALECVGALLVVVEPAAVAPDNDQQLDHVLVTVGSCVCVGTLNLAVELRRALPQDKGIRALRVLFEERLPLLCLCDVLLPQEYLPRVDGVGCRVRGDRDRRQMQVSDCLGDLWSPFILLLDVVRDGVHRLLVLGRVFRVADVEGVAF